MKIKQSGQTKLWFCQDEYRIQPGDQNKTKNKQKNENKTTNKQTKIHKAVGTSCYKSQLGLWQFEDTNLMKIFVQWCLQL